MIVEFYFENTSDGFYAFYSTDFPNIDFKIGESIWICEFKQFLQKGFFEHNDDDISILGELKDTSGLVKITDISHCYHDNEYFKKISVKEL